MHMDHSLITLLVAFQAIAVVFVPYSLKGRAYWVLWLAKVVSALILGGWVIYSFGSFESSSTPVFIVGSILIFLHLGKEYFKQRNKPEVYESNRTKALSILKNNGLSAHFYTATMGCRRNIELFDALDFLSSNGYIITDGSDNLVGKVAKANMDSAELASERRATFTIVE